MTNMFFEQSISNFLEAIASDDPVPGGGSVGAYTAATGIALVIMALKISIKKTNNKGQLLNLIKRSQFVLDALKVNLIEDIECFSSFIEAKNKPNNNEIESNNRQLAINEAAIKATAVPISAASHCVTGLKIAVESIAICRKTILSDVYTGANLLNTSCNSILLNVDANLNLISSKDKRNSYSNAKIKLMTEASDLFHAVKR
ncbi:formiminotransferase-cyclodeaminase family protein [Candidatus Endolissoclinum faulkneri L2]|uniref:Formiminotransferase-cyclodeaminase family protein n=1 Tax=Candidatus Endolissoclinum faulkneri L2 TaxID=1193729 RepID=K7Z3K3_9PROT|nr:cyclodeaminase/cyclohydrolase family protein [Candidatus Endolissoclinum faulkneri]AFX98563.1 formiminotransferase-cyclodeaminase family protein [Candidatus Endolissoclinum faulkneri L2]